MTNIPKTLIFDLDGVFTDGKIYVSEEGKVFKVFGPDDHDAIKLIGKLIRVLVVTADEKGFAISRRRIEEDLGLNLFLVSSHKRIEWIKDRYVPTEVVYVGDGIFDHLVFKEVLYSIAPRNASKRIRDLADYVCASKGGEGAVAEASFHVAKHFFNVELLELGNVL